MKKKIIIILGLVILVFLGYLFTRSDEEEIKYILEEENEVEVKTIIVQILGEVKSPGVYEMNEGDRVNDLVIVAGGLTNKASPNVNLVQKLEDGMVIVIASNEENDGKISINKASLEELMTLKGIGESKAKSIIAYRQENGGFKNLEELMNVKGITANIYEEIKDSIKL